MFLTLPFFKLYYVLIDVLGSAIPRQVNRKVSVKKNFDFSDFDHSSPLSYLWPKNYNEPYLFLSKSRVDKLFGQDIRYQNLYDFTEIKS